MRWDAMRTRTRHSDVSASTATKRYLTKVTGETAGEDSAGENGEMAIGWGLVKGMRSQNNKHWRNNNEMQLANRCGQEQRYDRTAFVYTT